jgi:hypothetical protein
MQSGAILALRGAMDYEVKTKEIHIATRRLFDSISTDLEQELHFDDWELKHLAECKECEHIRDVFGRQFSEMNKNAARNR